MNKCYVLYCHMPASCLYSAKLVGSEFLQPFGNASDWTKTMVTETTKYSKTYHTPIVWSKFGQTSMLHVIE